MVGFGVGEGHLFGLEHGLVGQPVERTGAKEKDTVYGQITAQMAGQISDSIREIVQDAWESAQLIQHRCVLHKGGSQSLRQQQHAAERAGLGDRPLLGMWGGQHEISLLRQWALGVAGDR
jgi:hypothetical protein